MQGHHREIRTCPFWEFVENRALETTASNAQSEQCALSVGMWIALTYLYVLFESVFVKKGGASNKVGHKELARDTIMLKEPHQFLQSNNVPPPSTMILDGNGDQASSSRC